MANWYRIDFSKQNLRCPFGGRVEINKFSAGKIF